MTINNYTGVIYDVINYNVIYFNKESIHSQLKIYAKKDEDIFAFYDEFRKGKHAVTPPENLYPFFFYDIKAPCVLSQYFYKKFDYFSDTYVEYFNTFQNIEQFKRYVFFFYLEQYRDKINIEAVIEGDKKEITKASVAMRYHGERANTFIDLFYDFESAVNELIKYLKRLLHKMKLFHSKKKGLYQAAIEKFINSDNVNPFKKVNNIKDEVKFSKQLFAVCFMNRYVILYKGKTGTSEYSFIVGSDCCQSIRKNADYSYLTYAAVSKVFAHEITDDIIKELTREELTITKLSMKLNTARTTVNKFVGFLYDELAIQVSRANGNEKYYRLNPEYFLVAKRILNEKIDNILLDYKTSNIK